jgi:hypothetical protein
MVEIMEWFRPLTAGLPVIMRPPCLGRNEVPAKRMEAAVRMPERLEVPSEPI